MGKESKTKSDKNIAKITLIIYFALSETNIAFIPRYDGKWDFRDN